VPSRGGPQGAQADHRGEPAVGPALLEPAGQRCDRENHATAGAGHVEGFLEILGPALRNPREIHRLHSGASSRQSADRAGANACRRGALRKAGSGSCSGLPVPGAPTSSTPFGRPPAEESIASTIGTDAMIPSALQPMSYARSRTALASNGVISPRARFLHSSRGHGGSSHAIAGTKFPQRFGAFPPPLPARWLERLCRFRIRR